MKVSRNFKMYPTRFLILFQISRYLLLADGFLFSKPQRGDLGDPPIKKDKHQDKLLFDEIEDHKPMIKLASPPPIGTGLYAAVQKLQDQVIKLQQSYDKERSKIRRLERRVRDCKDGVAIAKSDVIQLKQNVVELTGSYRDLQESVQDIRVQNSGLEYELKQNKKDLSTLRVLSSSNSDVITDFQNNLSKIGSQPSTANVGIFQNEIKSISAKQSQLSKQVSNLQKDFKSVFAVSVNNTVKTYTFKLTNGINMTKDFWNEIDIWGSGSAEVENEFIIIGEHEGDIDIQEISGDGELPELFPEYEDLIGIDKYDELKSNISNLEFMFQGLTNHVKEMTSENILERVSSKLETLMTKESEKLEDLGEDRDEAIAQLQQQYDNMVVKINALDQKVQSIKLGDFMKNLQESLINFTQNVITLEQWKVASTQIINATQYNQKQIMKLQREIITNTNVINQLNWVTADSQGKVDQQYRVLQMHIINLNNSLQDLREHVTYIGTIQLPTRRHNVRGGSTRYLPPSNDVLSRLEDLGLQITFNENRISNIENRVLNKSLFECQKANTDLFQDSQLAQIDSEIGHTRKSLSIMKEMFKRLDRAIYRVHTYAKNSSEVIYKLQSKFFSWDTYIPIIQLLRQEVNNLLYTLPIDCNAYHRRGYTASEIYVIFPPRALQSFRIPCMMEDKGGWTVIQRRIDGKTKFSRDWSEYAVGFGSPMGEFWIGNEFLHLLTSNQNYSLQIEMVDIFDGYWLVDYKYFHVASKENEYRLNVDGFSGNATDGMAYSNDMAFSTQDSDNDLSSTHCALYYTAGWWYRHCQYSNLNGRYDVGVVWFNKEWQDWIQLKSTIMKIRPQIS